MLIYKIDFAFDKGAEKFYVVRSDISGLRAEAKTVEGLVEVICDIAPELIEANHVPFRIAVWAFLRGLFTPTTANASVGGFNLRLSQDLSIAH